jgi:hypothetical protein
MSLTIMILDQWNKGTVIAAGALVGGRHSPMRITSAKQIGGWKVFPKPNIFRLLDSLERGDQLQEFDPRNPFLSFFPALGMTPEGGACLSDTNSLFLYNDMKKDNDAILMVLWQFPIHPSAGSRGPGKFNAPSDSPLQDGDIDWEIFDITKGFVGSRGRLLTR